MVPVDELRVDPDKLEKLLETPDGGAYGFISPLRSGGFVSMALCAGRLRIGLGCPHATGPIRVRTIAVRAGESSRARLRMALADLSVMQTASRPRSYAVAFVAGRQVAARCILCPHATETHAICMSCACRRAAGG